MANSDDDWRVEAACASKAINPDVFFPERGSETYQSDVQAARSICAGCPVRVECLEDALSDPELDGVWGGYTAEQRSQINRRNIAKGLRVVA